MTLFPGISSYRFERIEELQTCFVFASPYGAAPYNDARRQGQASSRLLGTWRLAVSACQNDTSVGKRSNVYDAHGWSGFAITLTPMEPT
jgi:hypothetical protein